MGDRVTRRLRDMSEGRRTTAKVAVESSARSLHDTRNLLLHAEEAGTGKPSAPAPGVALQGALVVGSLCIG